VVKRWNGLKLKRMFSFRRVVDDLFLTIVKRQKIPDPGRGEDWLLND
jgi:hypothetical protein